jgi:hypothetical protein
LFQNPVGFEQAPGKTGQKPGFSTHPREAVPKTEVLEQPPETSVSEQICSHRKQRVQRFCKTMWGTTVF